MRKPAAFSRSLVCFVSKDESAGKTVADSACLTGEAAADNSRDNIELTGSAGNFEGLVDDELQRLKTEIFVQHLCR